MYCEWVEMEGESLGRCETLDGGSLLILQIVDTVGDGLGREGQISP